MPLAPPPRNADGAVLPHDHSGIDGSDGVLRRVSPKHMVDDPKVGGKRLSSMAFQPSSGPTGGMSVDLQRLIEDAGLDPKKFVLAPPWIGAVRFTAGGLRSLGLKVGYDPVEGNPYHGEVWGDFTRRVQKSLMEAAETFVPPALD